MAELLKRYPMRNCIEFIYWRFSLFLSTSHDSVLLQKETMNMSSLVQTDTFLFVPKDLVKTLSLACMGSASIRPTFPSVPHILL